MRDSKGRFLKGRMETSEEKLNRLIAIEEDKSILQGELKKKYLKIEDSPFKVKSNGDVCILGIGGYNGTNLNTARSVQEVINELVNKLNEITTND